MARGTTAATTKRWSKVDIVTADSNSPGRQHQHRRPSPDQGLLVHVRRSDRARAEHRRQRSRVHTRQRGPPAWAPVPRGGPHRDGLDRRRPRSTDDQPGASPVVIIGHRVWQNRYDSDPQVLGHTLRANSKAVTIVGVMPPDMRFPDNVDICVPRAQLPPETLTGRRDSRNLQVIGRLAGDVPVDQARVELTGLGRRLSQAYPATNDTLIPNLLACLAGVAGVGLAVAGVRWFDVATQDVGKPYGMEVTMDGTVFVFIAAICLATGVLFGLAPALHVSKTDVNEVIKEGGRRGSGGLRVRRWTRTLIITEVALTLVPRTTCLMPRPWGCSPRMPSSTRPVSSMPEAAGTSLKRWHRCI